MTEPAWRLLLLSALMCVYRMAHASVKRAHVCERNNYEVRMRAHFPFPLGNSLMNLRESVAPPQKWKKSSLRYICCICYVGFVPTKITTLKLVWYTKLLGNKPL